MQSYPFITIGIPTKNAIKYIPRFLDALYAISYPKKSQRIVFIDASDDETYSFITEFKEEHNNEYESILVIREVEFPTYRLYPLALQRLSQARNICIANAIGDFFLSLDCDVIIEPDVITKLLNYFKTSTKIGAIGISYYRTKRSFFDKVMLSQGKQGLRRVNSTGLGCTMFKMDILKLVGNFDESRWGIDTEIYQRIKRQGYETYLDFATIYEHISSPGDDKGNIFQRLLKHSGQRYAEIKKNRPLGYIRQIIFFSAYLVSIVFVIVSYIPLLILTIIGFIFYFIKARGINRLINPAYFFVVGILMTLSFYYHFLRDLFSLEEY